MSGGDKNEVIERDAPAKINLWLEVLDERADGYHNLRTIMQTVDLSDKLRLRCRRDGSINLRSECSELPEPEDNLVTRAARLLQQRTGTSMGADIELTKNIPIGAGLGGGSSDCAATLMALRRLWGLDCGRDLLEKIAAELGSDIPFFLYGGTALCEGRGEIVSPLEVKRQFDYTLILPEVSISTPDVYEAYEPALTKTGAEISICTVQRALESGKTELLAQSLHNDLQKTAFQHNREIRHTVELIESLLPCPECLGYSLSGSGAAFFAVCETSADSVSLACKVQSSGLPAVPVCSGLKQS